MAGVSRSATLVIAFLMRSRLLSFEEAYNLVKQKRKIVFLLAFRSIPIHHLFNNYDSSRLNFSNQIKNSQTNQQAVLGILPNQKIWPLKNNTTKDSKNKFMICLSKKRRSKAVLDCYLLLIIINEENIFGIK